MNDFIRILGDIWTGIQTIAVGFAAGSMMILVSLIQLIALPFWHLRRAINQLRDRRQESSDRTQNRA